jgi:hypothetical protein
MKLILLITTILAYVFAVEALSIPNELQTRDSSFSINKLFKRKGGGGGGRGGSSGSEYKSCATAQIHKC